MKYYICRRLGPFVKYTYTWSFYWEQAKNQFQLTTTHFYVVWVLTWYVAFFCQVVFLAYLLLLLRSSPEIPEEISIMDSKPYAETLVLCIGFAFWLFMTCLLSTGSLGIQHREEMVEALNQLFKLDALFQAKYPTINSTSFHKTRHIELLIKLAVVTSLVLPIVIACAFFHEGDPVRNMCEAILEMELRIESPYAWCILLCEMYTVLCYSTNALTWVVTIGVIIYASEAWLTAGLPVGCSIVNRFFGTNCVRTFKLGKVQEQHVIRLYRCFQLLTNLENCVVAKARMAYHYVALMMAMVIVSFGFIRTVKSLVNDGSLSAYLMLGFLCTFMFLVLFAIYYECYLLDGLDEKWKEFQLNLIRCNGRNTFGYKTALSFRAVTVKTAYPFFNINMSTFLEWCSVYTCRLVDFLLTT